MSERQLTPAEQAVQDERQRRWRLILGKMQEQSSDEDEVGGDSAEQGEGEEEGTAGEGPSSEDESSSQQLSEEDQKIDDALDALYGEGEEGGLEDAAPDIARWLGDIRTYFSKPVANMIQRDALKKIKLRKLIDDPDFMAEIEPDMELVTQLLALRRVMPAQTLETAKQVVRDVVEELRKKLQYPLEQAITGSMTRSLRANRPRHSKEINWTRTIEKNLKHYQPQHKTIVPERLVGFGRKRNSLRDVILCIDQSGSMAASVVYASIFGSVMASLPALALKLVVFSTKVVDLSDELHDPVALLFGLQLRGGTNIDRALNYCQQLVTRPDDTVLVLITDLYEGGNKASMVRRVAQLTESGVKVVVLLALNDQGAPRFNRIIAQELVAFGVPSFACTPDLFPGLMGAILSDRDLEQWAASEGIVTAPDN